MSNRDLDFIINELGEEREDYKGAVVPPIYQSSNFAFSSLDDFSNAFANEAASHLYTRGNNPTVKILREKLAALECCEDALVFSSGVAAMAAAVMSQVKQGDHVICIADSYSWTKYLLESFLRPFGIETTFTKVENESDLEKPKKDNTRLIILESPNSMTFEVVDLAACAKWAKANNITTICDNSYASPIFQQPAALGIDLIVHSGSKYINGHSDVVCGILCGPKKLMDEIFVSQYQALGRNH